ncbi:MAG: ribonuclease HII [Bacteriovoracaceae bacterium]
MYKDGKYLKLYEEIIGCDEVGRGPLAGPVVGCALKVNQENKNLLRHLKKLGVNDSKKLSAEKRQEILQALQIETYSLELNTVYTRAFKNWTFEFVLTEHCPADIERLNILQASLSCMKRAAQALISERTFQILVDGNRGFDVEGQSATPVIKGDFHFLCISLASIIAKEFRDEKMRAFDLLYPGYGLSNHVGYPTMEHREALRLLGASPIHRKSYKGVKEFVCKRRE